MKNWQNAVRKARLKRAYSDWACPHAIWDFYCLAADRIKTTGILWVVDHIIPIKGRGVCGLHNEFNLQVVPNWWNVQKGNKNSNIFHWHEAFR